MPTSNVRCDVMAFFVVVVVVAVACHVTYVSITININNYGFSKNPRSTLGIGMDIIIDRSLLSTARVGTQKKDQGDR